MKNEGECRLTMLGTGNAAVTKCYNTCFLLHTGKAVLLVDAGGGNGILTQLEKAGVRLYEIHDIYLTHVHTDHILGAVWVVRMISQAMKSGKYDGRLNIYGHRKVLDALDGICRLTLSPKQLQPFGERIFFREVSDGEDVSIGDIRLKCFDIMSEKEKQFGFRATLPGGKTLVCLGDEPYDERNSRHVCGADLLMCEAFCLYRDRDVFKPYEKHHSTALEAGAVAAQCNVRNLLLYHTEDRTLAERKAAYSAEAAVNFKGGIFVPDDLEVIEL